MNRWSGDIDDSEELAELHSSIQFAESIVGDYLATETLTNELTAEARIVSAWRRQGCSGIDPDDDEDALAMAAIAVDALRESLTSEATE